MHGVCYEYMTPSSILLLQGEEVPFELEFFGDHKCSSAEIDLTLTFFLEMIQGKMSQERNASSSRYMQIKNQYHLSLTHSKWFDCKNAPI